MNQSIQKLSVVGDLRQRVRERMPDKVRERLDMVRGLFAKDPKLQMQKMITWMRYFREFRRIDRALFEHRFAANLLLSYRLGIFEVLLKGPADVEQIAGRCDIKEGAALNLLQILEAQELIIRRGRGYEATPAAAEFFDPAGLVSMVPMFEVCETYARSFPSLIDAARTGQTPSLLDVFDDDCQVDSLLDGVNYYLDQAGRQLVAAVDWPPIKEIIVGSMGVSFSSLVLDAFPEARVTYGCLPRLVERIPRLRQKYRVPADRVVDMHAHGGEPSQDQWGAEAFDMVFLTKKMILDPATGLGEKFARKAFEVLNPGGVTVFWETIHYDRGGTPIQQAMESFLDFGVSPTGPVLKESGFRRTLEEIGYRNIEVVSCLEGATTFVVARRESHLS